MFGMLGGGWKFGGKPGVRPGCGAFACCIPGGAAVPGGGAIPGGAIAAGAIPGGGAKESKKEIALALDWGRINNEGHELTHARRRSGITAKIRRSAIETGGCKMLALDVE